MKNYNLFAFYITGFFIFLLHQPVPVSGKPALKSREVIISGRVEGGGKKDTVTLYVKKQFVYHNIGTETLKTACNENGTFSFTVEISHFAVASVSIHPNQWVFLRRYLEEGDSIYCHISRKQGNNYSVSYSGRSEQKFRCMSVIDSARIKLDLHPVSKIPKAPFSEDTLVNEVIKSIRDSEQKASALLGVLKSNKYGVRPQFINLLAADILGETGRDLCYFISSSFKQADSSQQEKIRQLFLAEIFSKGNILTGSAAYSESYIEFLYWRCNLYLKLLHGQSSMKEVYSFIAKEYKGFIRDRVIASYLLRGQIGVSNSELEWCLRDAIPLISEPEYKMYLQQQVEKITPGSTAYNFILPAPDGKFFSLKEFRGRVVVVDFWFTGCSMCKVLSASLEKDVVPKFKDRLVSFISVCLDKDKEKWLKSLAGGGYTAEGSINLFTEGLAFDHPFPKYYNIQGCPSLILIDKKGCIISLNPAWKPDDLINQLNEALK